MSIHPDEAARWRRVFKQNAARRPAPPDPEQTITVTITADASGVQRALVACHAALFGHDPNPFPHFDLFPRCTRIARRLNPRERQ